MPVSAGILIFKKNEGKLSFLLSHPGGPYYKNKDDGVWGIPKGLVEDSEDMLQAAKREFVEETGLLLPDEGFWEMPVVKYRNGKILHSFAVETDPLNVNGFKSNTFTLEWPPKSGKICEFPEIDKLSFFEITAAMVKIHPVQLPLIETVAKQV